MTAPEPRPMIDAEADYLLAAGLGLAQGARLIPVRDLAAHFEQRFHEARARGTDNERRTALAELAFAENLQVFVGMAEHLMDARRNATLAEIQQAKAEAQQLADLPPSRQPLATDDAWVSPPPRAPR